MGKPYLIDANAIIDYVGNRLPEQAALEIDKLVDEEFHTSIVAKIEVLRDFKGISGIDCTNPHEL